MFSAIEESLDMFLLYSMRETDFGSGKSNKKVTLQIILERLPKRAKIQNKISRILDREGLEDYNKSGSITWRAGTMGENIDGGSHE
ncbi:MAG: hypothetical protein HFG71_07550 [Hungatella sp.]|nr:hypothetical protein [Hungatella sp.]